MRHKRILPLQGITIQISESVGWIWRTVKGQCPILSTGVPVIIRNTYLSLGWCTSNRTMVRFSNRKDYLWIFRVKKQVKDLNYALFDFQVGTKIWMNESICPYYKDLWNKYKGMKNKNQFTQFYFINKII